MCRLAASLMTEKYFKTDCVFSGWAPRNMLANIRKASDHSSIVFKFLWGGFGHSETPKVINEKPLIVARLQIHIR